MRSVLYIVRAVGNTLLVVAVGHFLDNTLLVVLTNGECEIPTTYTYFGEFLIRVCKMRPWPFTNQKSAKLLDLGKSITSS